MGANLSGVRLNTSDLANADLSGAHLTGAHLSSAVFSPDTTYNQYTLFPPEFNPIAGGTACVGSPAGDFDGDNFLAGSDVQILTSQIRGIDPWWLPQAMFNLNGDSFDSGEPIIDTMDLRIWVKDLKHTWYGDADLDGEFTRFDIVSLLQAGQCDDGIYGNSTWPRSPRTSRFGRSHCIGVPIRKDLSVSVCR
jgi:hypothetical protein